MRTTDSNVLAQCKTLDGMAEGLDVEFSLKVPDEGICIEHIAGELGEGGRIRDNKATGQV